jgi:hypothetical protein
MIFKFVRSADWVGQEVYFDKRIPELIENRPNNFRFEPRWLPTFRSPRERWGQLYRGMIWLCQNGACGSRSCSIPLFGPE